MRPILPVIASLLFATLLSAQTPYLVKDIAKRSGYYDMNSSSPTRFTDIDGTILFNAQFPGGTWNLGKIVSGTAQRVSETGVNPATIHRFAPGVALYAADDSSGRELWRTDGTAAGTFRVKDTNPTASGNVFVFGVYHGLAYLNATTVEHGRELWVSDGTEAGTRLLKDLNGTSASSSPVVLGVFGSRVAFLGAGGLWLTDGTEAGTTLVKGGIGAQWVGAIAGTKIFFPASDPIHGYELWVSDGTEAGTHMVVEIRPSATGSPFYSDFPEIIAVGDRVLFFGWDATPDKIGVWASDGTAAGTQFVAARPRLTCWDPCEYDYMESLAGLGYFLVNQSELWRSDGTQAGTYPIDSNASTLPFAAFGSTYFVRKEATDLFVVRRTDGTSGGTTTTMTLPTGNGFAWPQFAGGKLYFQYAGYPNGAELWVAENDTSASLLANLLPDTAPSSSPALHGVAGNRVFFTARDDGDDWEIWGSDGTDSGTVKLTDVTPASNRAVVTAVASLGSKFLFAELYSDLWSVDGTSEVTTLLAQPGSLNANRYSQFPEGGLAFFSAGGSSSSNRRPWITDGSVTGTKELVPGTDRYDRRLLFPSAFVQLASRTYFFAGEDEKRALWRSEGTAGSTTPVLTKDGDALFVANGGLYFSSQEGGSLWNVWRSDGSAQGNVKLGSSISKPAEFVAAGPLVYFAGDDGETGVELWRTDGTPQGTTRVANIRPGVTSANPSALTALGDVVFFAADDGLNGVELWRSDGTEAGTYRVKDIAPGATSSNPTLLHAADGSLWFVANDGTHGAELWTSDGTPSGTRLVADLAPGSASSNPARLLSTRKHLFFAASEPMAGTELWAIAFSSTSWISIADVRSRESSANAQFVVTRTGALDQFASVSWHTADGIARAGSDYVGASGTVTFNPGETTKFISIALLPDEQPESDESFSIRLSGPTSGVLSRAAGFGIVEDDDAIADLAIEIFKPNYSGEIGVRIRNLGPSTATAVAVRATFSPGLLDPCFGCDAPIPALAPGATQEFFSKLWGPRDPITDGDIVVGRLLSVTVSAVQPDPNPANSRHSRLTDLSARLLLPPFLRTGESGSGSFFIGYPYATSVSSDSPIVTISPSTFPSPSQNSDVTFTLTAGNTSGIANISATPGPRPLPLQVIGAGQTPRLASEITAQTRTPREQQAFEIPVTIWGKSHDGVLPTGYVNLRTSTGSLVQRQQLDGTAKATLVHPGLPEGQHRLKIDYEGDATFLPTRGSVGINVLPYQTALTVAARRTGCGMAEVVVTLRNLTSSVVLTDPVEVYFLDIWASMNTIATGIPGESRAIFHLAVSNVGQVIYAVHQQSASYSAASTTLGVSDCSEFASSLFLVTPCRVTDTRGGPQLGPSTSRAIKVTGKCGVPATARAVAANITVVSPSSSGFLRVFPARLFPMPSTYTLSFRPNSTRATGTIATLNSEGEIEVLNGGSQPVHFIIDITGYFQ